jgi:hypothetical protein
MGRLPTDKKTNILVRLGLNGTTVYRENNIIKKKESIIVVVIISVTQDIVYHSSISESSGCKENKEEAET